MGQVTTHVLDTAAGRPAEGVRILAVRIDGESATVLGEAVTNADGRCDGPILSGAGLTAGIYELRFHVGAYFREHGGVTASPPFLDVVPVRFGIAAPDQHYHVPLLISPYGYSTYRGS